MNMRQQGFARIALIALVIIFTGMAGCLVRSQKNPALAPSPQPSSTPALTPAPTPTTTPVSEPKNGTISVALGQQFTLKKGQVAKVGDTGLEIEITAFYNSPCPAGVQCIWSGVGIGFEYRFNGQVQNGVDLEQAFGYRTTIVKTDHETYANLVVEKMK